MDGWPAGRDGTGLPEDLKRTLDENAKALLVDIDGGDGGGSWRGKEGGGGWSGL